jgi:hypothetical protein
VTAIRAQAAATGQRSADAHINRLGILLLFGAKAAQLCFPRVGLSRER